MISRELGKAAMPSRNPVLTAARFEIVFNGSAVGRFETLIAATAPGAAPRALQVHELPMAWQHSGEIRSGKFTQADHKFETPTAGTPSGRRLPPTLVLKRGTGRRASLERWQTLGSSSVDLVGLDPAGRPIARYRLSRASVVKVTGPTSNARGGGDIAIEEIVIAYEGVSPA
jgi:hypothetical protein